MAYQTIKRFTAVALMMAGLFGVTVAQAALVTRTDPDVGGTFLADYDYVTEVDVTCKKGGNTSILSGVAGTSSVDCSTLGGGWSEIGSTITDQHGLLTIEEDAGLNYSDNLVGGSNTNEQFVGDYLALLNFDGAGNFVDGTVNLDYVSDGPGGALTLQDSNVMTAGESMFTGDITAMSLLGGDKMDFYISNLGGAMAALFPGNDGGAILQLSMIGSFTSDWTASGTGQDTFVQTVIPVPAAVWLFGSGLLGLAGVARRRG